MAENLVEKNQPVTDSGTQAVLEVAQQASKSAVVVVDLKDGDAWYKTRLFALTAPALEFGYPRIIVFLATQNASAAAFLGFADALAVSSSIMQDQNYKTAFSNAVAKYYQLAAFAKDELRPFNLALVPVVQGEAYDFRGRSSLMALLIHETMHLEPPMQPEPWVKALDLQHLLGDDLHTDKIEDRKRDPEVILRFCLEVPTILLSFAASLRRSCIGRARHARGAWNVGSPTLINRKRQIAPAMLHCAKMRLQRRRGHFVSTTARSEK